jgi:N-sulfoglucosamine sulfohydrolase
MLRTLWACFWVAVCIRVATTGDTEAADRDLRSPRPNILWLIAEDQSVDWGCYGVSAVSTPNIDQFASEGVVFSLAFSTAPVCSTSRSCFNTGVYQTSFGGHHHRSHRKGYSDYPYPLPDPIRHVSEYFRDAGYFTCNSDETFSRAGKEDYNFTSSKSWDGRSWNQRASGQPFFAQVNIKNMDHHGGYGRVDPSQVSVPPYHPDRPLTRAVWAHYYERTQSIDQKVGAILQKLKDDGLEENTIVFLFGDNGRQVQRGMQYLYDGGIHVPMLVRWPTVLAAGTKSVDLVSHVDLAPTSLSIVGIKPPQHMQGQVFLGPDSSKRKFIFAARDRMDETMDRIRCVRSARYKYIRNYTVWGESKRRPYTTWGPYYEVNRQSNLYKMHNYPILSLLHVLHARGELDATQELFMVNEKPREELYDLAADPHELNNLATSREYYRLKQELAETLDNWMLSMGDQGRVPEDPSVSDQWYDQAVRPRNIQKATSRDGINVDSAPEEYLQYWRSHYHIAE